jgi:putative sigma-54 modulation protein
MQISVTFRHVDPSVALKDYAIKKITKLKKYLDGPVEASVVLGIEKFRHLADISFTYNGLKIKAHEETGDMYSAIDLAVEKIEKQVKRLREKPRSLKTQDTIKNLGMRLNVVSPSAEAEEKPRILRSRQVEPRPMDLEEAILQLTSGSEDVVVFINDATETLSILYRRRDGNYGLLEPVLD